MPQTFSWHCVSVVTKLFSCSCVKPCWRKALIFSSTLSIQRAQDTEHTHANEQNTLTDASNYITTSLAFIQSVYFYPQLSLSHSSHWQVVEIRAHRWQLIITDRYPAVYCTISSHLWCQHSKIHHLPCSGQQTVPGNAPIPSILKFYSCCLLNPFFG